LNTSPISGDGVSASEDDVVGGLVSPTQENQVTFADAEALLFHSQMKSLHGQDYTSAYGDQDPGLASAETSRPYQNCNYDLNGATTYDYSSEHQSSYASSHDTTNELTLEAVNKLMEELKASPTKFETPPLSLKSPESETSYYTAATCFDFYGKQSNCEYSPTVSYEADTSSTLSIKKTYSVETGSELNISEDPVLSIRKSKRLKKTSKGKQDSPDSGILSSTLFSSRKSSFDGESSNTGSEKSTELYTFALPGITMEPTTDEAEVPSLTLKTSKSDSNSGLGYNKGGHDCDGGGGAAVVSHKPPKPVSGRITQTRRIIPKRQRQSSKPAAKKVYDRDALIKIAESSNCCSHRPSFDLLTVDLIDILDAGLVVEADKEPLNVLKEEITYPYNYGKQRPLNGRGVPLYQV